MSTHVPDMPVLALMSDMRAEAALKCVTCVSQRSFAVPSTWYKVLGAKYLVPGTKYLVRLGTKSLLPRLGTKNMALGTKCVVPSTCYQ